jgi:hypothetical protein
MPELGPSGPDHGGRDVLDAALDDVPPELELDEELGDDELPPPDDVQPVNSQGRARTQHGRNRALGSGRIMHPSDWKWLMLQRVQTGA